jgi:outer membrane protein TolC
LVDDLDYVINYGNDKAVINQKFDYAANIDFRLAMSDQRLQELNFKNTKVQYLPKVNAFYNYQETYQNNELALSQHDWFPTNLWGFSVSMPVFSSFMRKYQVDQAKIEFEKAQLNSDQVSQELTLNYSTLLSNYEFAMERFKNNEKNLDLVKLILEKETVKFNEGISTSLDLANAQLQFFEIQASYIQSLSDLIEIRSELDKILNNY